MLLNRDEINDKVFLDEEGEAWRTYSPAGTGEYEWYCRNVESDASKTFLTNFVVARISSYDRNVKEFENKELLESEMFNFIKKISGQILRKEILKEEDWSNKELDMLNIFRNGKFDVKFD